MASTSTICAPPSPTPTSTRPRAASTAPARSYTINANDQLTDPELYKDVVVAYRNGAPVHLRDVANVEEGAGEQPARRLDRTTTQAVMINVQRQPGANVIEVVDRIKELLPQLRETLPALARRRRS